jgi:hypothetical protein
VLLNSVPPWDRLAELSLRAALSCEGKRRESHL